MKTTTRAHRPIWTGCRWPGSATSPSDAGGRDMLLTAIQEHGGQAETVRAVGPSWEGPPGWGRGQGAAPALAPRG